MLKNYNQYILNEKKDLKAEKSGIEEKIMKLFKEKPEVKATSAGWPDSKGIYSLAGIKKYVGGDNLKTDQVFHDMRDDEKIKSVKVKINSLSETYPYYYHEEYTSKEEAEKCKETMEKSQKPVEKKNKPKPPEPKKRAPRKKAEPTEEKKPPVEKKPKTEKKPVTEKDLQAKAKAVVKRKKT